MACTSDSSRVRRLLCRLLALSLAASLSLASGEEAGDVYERLLPSMLSRLGEIQRVLVPVDDDILSEALYHAGSYYIPVDSESEACRNHSAWTFQQFLDREIWALKMVDAGSKLPSGLLDGNFMDLGNWDECVALEVPGGAFRGRHCVVETRGVMPNIERALNSQQRPFLPSVFKSFMFSVCVPSSCSARDVQVHMDVALNSVNASAILTEDSCSSRESVPWLRRELVAMFSIAVIIWSIIMSTIYDSVGKKSDRSGLLSSFSLRRNVARMLDVRQSDAALPCLNGLRVLAMAWVILGHRLLTMIAFPFLRVKNISEILPTLGIAPLLNAQLAVEVFFLLTGILLSYSFLRYMRQGKSFHLMQFYLFRYLRLTPALAAVTALYATVAWRLGEGPLWRRTFAPFRDQCLSSWWTNLVYANNYLNPNEMCVPQTWYLSVDFQLYVMSPLVLLPMCRRPKLSLGAIVALILISTAAAIANALQLELKAGGMIAVDRRTEPVFVGDYIVTHLRASSFLAGLALGYLLFRMKQGEISFKLSKMAVAGGWAASAALVAGTVLSVTAFHQPGYAPSAWPDALYIVLHRHVFAAGVAWIIFACNAGHGGIVDKFLSWPAFTPLARLTYCAYLTHVLAQLMDGNTQRSPVSLHWAHLWYHFAGDVTLGYLSGAVLYLTIEAPFANLVDFVFGPIKRADDSTKSSEKPKKISDCDVTSNREKIWTLPFDSRACTN